MSTDYKPFISSQESHRHSLKTLEALYEFDDFMESIDSVIDMGCGTGLDLEWWATRTTRDENPRPLDIRCFGIDNLPSLSMVKEYPNISYRSTDFEAPIPVGKRKYDVVWSHDSFQYAIDPFTTLKNWRDATNDGGMMILIVPQTTNLEFNTQAFDQRDGVYWHWTIVNLMHVLAVSGWDCKNGFFLKEPTDPWIHAVVYKSQHEPMDPKTTRWYDLAERGLLSDSAVNSINRHGYLRQRDLTLPWIDKSLHSFADH
jgi:SAM-dependent methyltransferase